MVNEKKIILDAHKKLLIRLAVIVLVLLCSIIPLFSKSSMDTSKIEVIDLGAVWTVNVLGNTYENVSLDDFKTDRLLGRGDSMSISCILPSKKVKNPIIRIYSVHSSVEIFLDGKPIYVYGVEDAKAGRMIGYGNHFVNLPDDYMNKSFEVVYNVTENDAFDGIPYAYIIDGSQLTYYILNDYKVALAINMTLIVIGICFIVLSFVMILKDTDFFKVFCIAYFSLLAGIWSMCNTDLISLFTDDPMAKVGLEYLSFYMMPIPFFYYFKGNVQSPKASKALKISYWTVLSMLLALFTVVIVSFATGNGHLSVFLKPCHILIVLGGIIIVWIIVSGAIKDKSNSKWMIIGICAALAIIGIELARFNLRKYVFGFTSNQYTPSLAIATFLIVMSMFIDYMDYNSRNLCLLAEQNVLKKMAYIDPLTRLKNRNAIDDIVLELEKKRDYQIVEFDMNRLKETNDTLGHEAGDVALCCIAESIRNAFEPLKGALIARTGGDEFIVVTRNEDAGRIDKALNQVVNKLDKLNEDNKEIPLSVSFGVAYAGELGQEETFKKIWDLADERMYEMKKKSKLAR